MFIRRRVKGAWGNKPGISLLINRERLNPEGLGFEPYELKSYYIVVSTNNVDITVSPFILFLQHGHHRRGQQNYPTQQVAFPTASVSSASKTPLSRGAQKPVNNRINSITHRIRLNKKTRVPSLKVLDDGVATRASPYNSTPFTKKKKENRSISMSLKFTPFDEIPRIHERPSRRSIQARPFPSRTVTPSSSLSRV